MRRHLEIKTVQGQKDLAAHMMQDETAQDAHRGRLSGQSSLIRMAGCAW